MDDDKDALTGSGKGTYRARGIQDRGGASTRDMSSSDALRAAKEYAEMIVDAVREGLLILDLDLRVQAANQSFYDRFETGPEETIGHLVYELGDGQWDVPELRELLEETLPGDKAMNDVEVTSDVPGIGRRVMLLNARQVNDHDIILLAIEDVTERKQAEGALRQSEEQLSTVLDTLPVGLVIADAEGRLVRDNKAARKLWGVPLEADSWRDYENFVGWWPDTGERIEAGEWGMSRALHHGEEVRNELILNQEFGSDEQHYFLNSVSPIWNAEGQIVGAVAAMVDVTKRVHAEKALERLNETLEQRVEERTEQLREVTARLTRAERKERHRIAQILHDDLQQLLYGTGLSLGRMREHLPQDEAREETGREEAAGGEAGSMHPRQLLDQAEEILNEAIGTARALSTELSPPVLKGEGLREAVTWLGSQMERKYGLTVELEAKGEMRVTDEDLRVLLFQVVRELLFNAVKHAGVETARVEIDHHEDPIRVRVVDEGNGFDPDREAHAGTAQDKEEGGFGLANMRAQLRLIGGHIKFDSAPGEGTRITVQAPTGPIEPSEVEPSRPAE